MRRRLPPRSKLSSGTPISCLPTVSLAESYLQWVSMQTQDPQVLERALESAQKVVTLSDSMPWGHSILGQGLPVEDAV